MSNRTRASSLSPLPIELWVDILRRAEPSPLQLCALRDEFSEQKVGSQPMLNAIASAAQVNELMKSCVTPDEYEEVRAETGSQQSCEGLRPPTLLERFEGELARLPEAARAHVTRVGHCRHVLRAENFTYDKKSFDLTVKCLHPGQAKYLLEVSAPEVKESRTSALLAVQNDPQCFKDFRYAVRCDVDVKSRALCAWPPNGQEICAFDRSELSVYTPVLRRNPLALYGLTIGFGQLDEENRNPDPLPESVQTPQLLVLRELIKLMGRDQFTSAATEIASLGERNMALAVALYHSLMGHTARHLHQELDFRTSAQLEDDRSYIKELLPLCQRVQ